MAMCKPVRRLWQWSGGETPVAWAGGHRKWWEQGGLLKLLTLSRSWIAREGDSGGPLRVWLLQMVGWYHSKEAGALEEVQV